VETHHQPIGVTGHFLKVIGETTEAVVIGEKPTNLKIFGSFKLSTPNFDRLGFIENHLQ